MKIIYKYPFPDELPVNEDPLLLSMHSRAEILSIQIQGDPGKIVIWAMVDDKDHLATRKIWIVTTGKPLPPVNLKYLGTIQHNRGAFVTHLFEEI